MMLSLEREGQLRANITLFALAQNLGEPHPPPSLTSSASIRGCDPGHRRAVLQDLSLPLVDGFFTWLADQAARASRKSDLGKALAYMLTTQDGFRLFLDDGHVDIDSNLMENAIRRPAIDRRNALFAGHDEGPRNWAQFASLIGTCKMNGVELAPIFATSSAALQTATSPKTSMPWADAADIKPSQ